MLDTPIGVLRILASERGLRRVMLPGDTDAVSLPTVSDVGNQIEANAARQLTSYFNGERTEFDLPLDLVGTEFQIAVWTALATVPFGERISYKTQAARVGRPKAVRAVGGANGRNPIPIILPCHRVVGANGQLTGYSGGVVIKEALLRLEAEVVGSW